MCKLHRFIHTFHVCVRHCTRVAADLKLCTPSHCFFLQVCVLPQSHHHRHTRLHPQGMGDLPTWQQHCSLSHAQLCPFLIARCLDVRAHVRTHTYTPPPCACTHCEQAKNGEQDRTPEDILAMVKAQAQPAHRRVVC